MAVNKKNSAFISTSFHPPDLPSILPAAAAAALLLKYTFQTPFGVRGNDVTCATFLLGAATVSAPRSGSEVLISKPERVYHSGEDEETTTPATTATTNLIYFGEEEVGVGG